MAADPSTVFGQCVAGGFIVLALALLKATCEQKPSSVLSPGMFGLWVLMGIGFIALMLHLGSPMRDFKLAQPGRGFSTRNEIASGSIFFAVGGIGCCWQC
ncbi:DmsC/YnfH family molybdoenzyme membrane anchor subunit [Escherichia coli]